jgi:hypothetical protein
VVVEGVPRVVLQLEGMDGVEIHTINRLRDAWEGGPPRNAVAAAFFHDSGEVVALRRSCPDQRTRWGQGEEGVAHSLAEGEVALGGIFDTAVTDNF